MVNVRPTVALEAPTFIIAGAPKSGTTSLSMYLGEHPRVFMTDPKEPHYFAEDLGGRQRFRSWERYQTLFEGVGPHHLAAGEASTWYLLSRVAADRIRERIPPVRIIVMLRRHPDFLYSLHSQLRFDQLEPEENFGRAWARSRAGDGPPFLRYDQLGQLGGHLERFLTAFPRRQVKVIFFDDFASDPGRVYHDVLDFLGLPDDQRREFPRWNSNKQLRHPRLAALVRRTPAWLAAPVLGAKRVLGLRQLGILTRVQRWNTRFAPRPPLDPDVRDELVAYFAEDVAHVEELTGRDLSSWKTSSAR